MHGTGFAAGSKTCRTGATLNHAGLTVANLADAKLTGATLYHTDLIGTILTGAKLIRGPPPTRTSPRSS